MSGDNEKLAEPYDAQMAAAYDELDDSFSQPNSARRQKSARGNRKSNSRTIRPSPLTSLLRDIMMPEQARAIDGEEKQNLARRERDDEVPSSRTAMTKTQISMARYEQNLGLVTGEDAITFFARNGKDAPVKFFYCNRARVVEVGGRSSFRPYDLTIVSRKEVNPEYFTISATGVVHVRPDRPSEFISLADWMHQSNSFNVLRSIRFFKHYLICKMFKLWQRNVRFHKFIKKRKKLSRGLFLARPSFSEPLLEVNRLLYEMETVKIFVFELFDIKEKDFQDAQRLKKTEATTAFSSIVTKLEASVEKVCKNVKERAKSYDSGHNTDDVTNSRFAQHLLAGNSRNKPMFKVKQEKAERKRQLLHAKLEKSMLGGFIMLVNYMETKSLVRLAIDNIYHFYVDLRNHTKNALFSTHVRFVLMPRELSFTPGVDAIIRVIREMIRGGISAVDGVQRIASMPNFKTYLANMAIEQPRIIDIIDSDRFQLKTQEKIMDQVTSDFKHTQIKSEDPLNKHRDVFEYGEGWDFEWYKAQDYGIQQIQEDIERVTLWLQDTSVIRESLERCTFTFTAQFIEMKEQLITKTKIVLEDMKLNLKNVFHEHITTLYEEITATNKSLGRDPEGLDEYARHKREFKQIISRAEDMRKRASNSELMFNLLKSQVVQVPTADEVVFENLLSQTKIFDEELTKAEELIKGKRTKMLVELTGAQAQLEQDFATKQTQLNQGAFVDPDKKAPEVLNLLKQEEAILAGYEEKMNILNEFHILFDDAESGEGSALQFRSFQPAMDSFNKRHRFWSTYDRWKTKEKEWKQMDFDELDVTAMDEEVSEMYRTVRELHGEFSRGGRASLVIKKNKD
jgi:dynein heavy chain